MIDTIKTNFTTITILKVPTASDFYSLLKSKATAPPTKSDNRIMSHDSKVFNWFKFNRNQFKISINLTVECAYAYVCIQTDKFVHRRSLLPCSNKHGDSRVFREWFLFNPRFGFISCSPTTDYSNIILEWYLNFEPLVFFFLIRNHVVLLLESLHR